MSFDIELPWYKWCISFESIVISSDFIIGWNNGFSRLSLTQRNLNKLLDGSKTATDELWYGLNRSGEVKKTFNVNSKESTFTNAKRKPQ